VGVSDGASQALAIIPVWLDVSAAAVGGVLGSLAAIRARYDINGALLVGVVTGLGGGMIRDAMLNTGLPAALSSPWLLPTAVIAALATFVFSRPVVLVHDRVGPVVLVLDAVFLAQYTATGVERGLAADLPFVSVVFIGVVTGVGGGILRDLLLHRSPVVLNPGTLEAGAALIGATVQAAAAYLVGPIWALVIGFGAVVALRICSVFLGWETRAARIDEPPADAESR